MLRSGSVVSRNAPRRSRRVSSALSFAALLALTATAAAPSFAQITNGSFELTPAYTGYTRIGATSLVTSSFGKTPPNGLQQAFIDNDSTSGSVSRTSLESFLGVSAGSLNGLGQGTVINGSAVMQANFTASAGTTLSFVYDFLTSEDPTFPPYNTDFSFVRLSGPGIGGNGLSLLANVSSATTPIPQSAGASPYIGDYLTETGYTTFSRNITTTGTYTLSFGVVNVDNSATPTGDIGSALLVDMLQLTPTAATPEPASAVLLLFGGPVYLTVRRRRGRRVLGATK